MARYQYAVAVAPRPSSTLAVIAITVAACTTAVLLAYLWWRTEVGLATPFRL